MPELLSAASYKTDFARTGHGQRLPSPFGRQICYKCAWQFSSVISRPAGMQEIVFDDPYTVVPPHRGTWWPSFIQKTGIFQIYLRKSQGVVDYEVRHAERLQASLDAGHGIMLTPNHARPGDPVAMGFLSGAVGCNVYAMASWHLFKQDWFSGFAIHKMGGFSLYREGMDRQAINTAIGILETAERPLILFPEGSVTRTNDRLHALLDGVAFIARTAAKKRQRHDPKGKIVVHPVAIKYLFNGDIDETLHDVLKTIEHRLTWQVHPDEPLLDRIKRIGYTLLALKEIEFLGRPQEGPMPERLGVLIDHLLVPLEDEWLEGRREGPVIPRVKSLRTAILPAMVRNEVDEQERARRWRQLANIYLAQQASCYFPDYLTERPSVTRILETVERFEEDLTDKVTVHGNLKVVLEVGEAIEVSPKRDRGAETDPLTTRIEGDLQSMLDRLAEESPLYEPGE
jgi:hypothetical protein